jgi:uncharacterized damage-inducible protein DinB
MGDSNQTEALTEQIELSSAQTQKLTRPQTAQSDEEFHAGQAKVLKMIAANAPLGQILDRLVKLIEAQSPDMLCSILLLSDDGNHVRHGAAPSLPEDYVKAIDGAPIGEKQGSCGTAMHRGEPVIVRDVLEDPLWEDYRDLATAAGLRACWSTPIMSGRGKVLGSFAMYYRNPRTPTGEEATLTDVATHIAGLAIEHQRAREALARTQAELAKANQFADTSQATASIKDFLLAEMNREVERSRRAREQAPASKYDWKPHEKSMMFGYLANMVATMPMWITMQISQDELDIAPKDGGKFEQKKLDTSAELVAALDKAAAGAREAFAKTTDEHLMTNWQLKAAGNAVMESPRHEMIQDTILHWAHHRGQMTVYLRLMGAKVPAIYGPSADDNEFR